MNYNNQDLKLALIVRNFNRDNSISDWQIIQDSLNLIKVCLVETTGGGLIENGQHPQEQAYKLCQEIEKILKLKEIIKESNINLLF